MGTGRTGLSVTGIHVMLQVTLVAEVTRRLRRKDAGEGGCTRGWRAGNKKVNGADGS